MSSNAVLLLTTFVLACCWFCYVIPLPSYYRLTIKPGDREYVPPQCGGDPDSGYGNICVNDTHCGPEGKCVYTFMLYFCKCDCSATPEGCSPKQIANCRDNGGIGRFTPCDPWDANGTYAHVGCVKGNLCNGLYSRQCRCKIQTTTTKRLTSTTAVPSTKTTTTICN